MTAFANWPGPLSVATVFCLCFSATASSKLHGAQQFSLKARLKSYGFAGVAAYGLLNTVYYITAFLFFWTHVAKVPRGEIFLKMSTLFKGLAVSPSQYFHLSAIKPFNSLVSFGGVHRSCAMSVLTSSVCHHLYKAGAYAAHCMLQDWVWQRQQRGLWA